MIKKHQQQFNMLRFLFDICAISLSFFIAWYFRFESGFFPEQKHLSFFVYINVLYLSIPFILIFNSIFGLYSPRRTKSVFSEIRLTFQTFVALSIGVFSLLFIFKLIDISRSFLAMFVLLGFLAQVAERSFVRVIMKKVRSVGFNIKYVLLIGSSELVKEYILKIRKNTYMGYKIIGILDDGLKKGTKIMSVPVVGKLDSVYEMLEKEYIDEVVIGLELDEYIKLPEILNACEKLGIRSWIIPAYYKYISTMPDIEMIDDIPLINTRSIPLDHVFNRFIKRSMDVLVSAVFLILLSPVMLLIAVCIKLTSGGKIIFSQTRVGYKRKTFTIYKFRTMEDTPDDQADTSWSAKDDPRKTRFGAFLRKTSLDELPQLFNVLKGDMSLVGPRPERPYFVEQFKEDIPKYMIKHHVKPGITGWAQVNGLRGDTSIRERIKHDIYYIESWTFSFDIIILWLTILKLFKNAY